MDKTSPYTRSFHSGRHQNNSTSNSVNDDKVRDVYRNFRNDGESSRHGERSPISVVAGGVQISSNPFQINTFLTNARSSREIFAIITNNINHFNEVNIVTAFNKLAHAFVDEGRVVAECSQSEKRILTDLQSKAFNYLDSAYLSIDGNKPINQVAVPKPFEERSLANLAWSYAKLGIDDRSFFFYIAWFSAYRIDNLNDQELANLAWAFAMVGIKDEALFKEIARVSKGKIHDFSEHRLVSLAWAYAKLGIRDVPFFIEIGKSASKKLDDFKDQELSNLAWAYAKLGIINEDLFKKIATVSMKEIGTASLPMIRLDHFCAQEFAHFLWTYAVIDLVSENQVFMELLMSKVQVKGSSFFNNEQLTQLKQTHLFLTKVKRWHDPWDADFLIAIDRRVLSHVKSRLSSSILQEDVANNLKESGYSFTEEYIDPESGYPIDIAFVEQKVAIEVDGPKHFVGKRREYNQLSKFKDVLLTACGWRVLHISYFKWDSVTDKEKADFLRNLIN